MTRMRIDARHAKGRRQIQRANRPCAINNGWSTALTMTSTILSTRYFSMVFAGRAFEKEPIVEWTDPLVHCRWHTMLDG